MTEQDKYNIQSDKYAEVIERDISVVVEGVPLTVHYAWNRADNDLVGLSIYTAADVREDVDITDIVRKHYEKKIDDAIMEDVKK